MYSIILNHSNLKLLACLVLPTEKHPCLFIAQSYVSLSGGNLNWTQWNLFASKMHQTAMLMLHLLHLLYLLGNLLAPSDNSVSANKYMLNFSRNLMKEPCFAEEKNSDWQLLPATWRGNYHQLQLCLLPSLYNVLSNVSKDHLMIDTWTYYDNFRGSTLHLECCHTLKTNITKDVVVSDLLKYWPSCNLLLPTYLWTNIYDWVHYNSCLFSSQNTDKRDILPMKHNLQFSTLLFQLTFNLLLIHLLWCYFLMG